MSSAQQARTERPGDWRSLVRAAVRCVGSGDFRRAERLLAAAKKLRPDQPEVLMALGRLRARQGLFGDAERFLRDAWQLSGRPMAAAALARLMARERGRPSDALELLDDAAGRHPKSSLVECVRGEVFLDAADFAAARRSFERALQIDPSCRAARVGLARTLVGDAIGRIDRGEAETALFMLRRATSLDGSWPMPHRAMAAAFDAMGLKGLAARSRQRATELS